MDKLSKLKEWFTVAETAKYLSIGFGTEVTEADVLRLALDEKLRMSVWLVNSTAAKRAEKISIPIELENIHGFTSKEKWSLSVQADEIIHLYQRVSGNGKATT